MALLLRMLVPLLMLFLLPQCGHHQAGTSQPRPQLLHPSDGPPLRQSSVLLPKERKIPARAHCAPTWLPLLLMLTAQGWVLPVHAATSTRTWGQGHRIPAMLNHSGTHWDALQLSFTPMGQDTESAVAFLTFERHRSGDTMAFPLEGPSHMLPLWVYSEVLVWGWAPRALRVGLRLPFSLILRSDHSKIPLQRRHRKSLKESLSSHRHRTHHAEGAPPSLMTRFPSTH